MAASVAPFKATGVPSGRTTPRGTGSPTPSLDADRAQVRLSTLHKSHLVLPRPWTWGAKEMAGKPPKKEMGSWEVKAATQIPSPRRHHPPTHQVDQNVSCFALSKLGVCIPGQGVSGLPLPPAPSALRPEAAWKRGDPAPPGGRRCTKAVSGMNDGVCRPPSPGAEWGSPSCSCAPGRQEPGESGFGVRMSYPRGIETVLMHLKSSLVCPK